MTVDKSIYSIINARMKVKICVCDFREACEKSKAIQGEEVMRLELKLLRLYTSARTTC